MRLARRVVIFGRMKENNREKDETAPQFAQFQSRFSSPKKLFSSYFRVMAIMKTIFKKLFSTMKTITRL